jgi:exodeoxyribonuclease V alpha subunit
MNGAGTSTHLVHHLGTQVQVGTRVRADGLHAAVAVIKRDGSVSPSSSTKPLIVKFPEDVKQLVAPGTVWLVDGPEFVTSYVHDGDRRYERTIKATNATFVKPTGQTLSRWLRRNVEGIGETLADRLVRNKHLSKWVLSRDRESLLAIHGMSDTTVDALLKSWPPAKLYEVIEFLDEHSIPSGISGSILKALDEDALPILKSNPFMLLGLGVSFGKVIAFAQKMGFTFDDPELVACVAAHAAFLHSEETGSTVINADELLKRSMLLTEFQMPENLGDIAVERKLMVKCGTSAYQSYGCALMEHDVAEFLVKSLFRPPGSYAGQAGMWETQVDRNRVEQALHRYEKDFQDFSLLPEQREAIIGSLLSPVSCISGGAGTGKTTIIRAVLGCYELLAAELPTYQVAIAGRASQRIAEATGKPAQTIAKLIAEHMGDDKPDLPGHLLLVIDEASMVDLLSMYRLVRFLPQAARVIFVGDSMQLIPVGKGLVFHALQQTGVPFFELKQPMRQHEQSGVHSFATNLRNGVVTFPPAAANRLADSSDCCMVASKDAALLAEYWIQAGGIGGAIVLSPVTPGPLGVDNLNRILQKKVGLDRAALLYRDSDRGLLPWVASDGLRFLKGDPILVTKNRYDINADVRNGDLGILEDVVAEPSGDDYFGSLRMNDGRRISIDADLLEKLSLGYAITIHKSQGSQWDTCFVTLPSNASRMIDQSLLYTAVTRAKTRILLFGDPHLIEAGIKRGPASKERITTLAARIRHLTDQKNSQS